MPSAEPSPKKARSDDVSLQGFLERVNGSYESVHTAFEHQFWGTKMALSTLSPDGQLCVCRARAHELPPPSCLRRAASASLEHALMMSADEHG